MDDTSAHEHKPVGGKPGGTVEPANRATVAKAVFQTPEEPAAQRYELRDPFAEAIYHAKSFDDMVAKADKAGAIRFTAISADSQRTHVHRVDGVWQRPEATQAREPDRPPARESASNAVPLATAASEAAVARIDAQAERAALVARLEIALNERYVIKRAPLKVGDVMLGKTEYRFRGDNTRIAFTESTFKLATDTNSPSVARSMVDVAQARNWRAIRVSGNEDFKRLVWLEASVRGVKTVGYEPVPGDLELLRKEREARQVNRIEPVQGGDGATASAPAAAAKQTARGGGGRKAVLAALEAVLVSRGVPDKQREAVMAAAAQNLAQRQAAGQTHKVKVLDRGAPSQRPVVTPPPEAQRARERATPVR